MKREFISNIGYLIFLNLLIKPFWILGIDRSVQNLMGPAEYGLYFALFNFAFLFQVVLDFGINNFNNRNIAQQPERLREYFATTFLAKCIFSILYTIIVFAVAFGIQFSPQQMQLLGNMILMQVMLSFYTFLRSNISALHLFKTDAFLSVLDKIVAIALCSIILWTDVLQVSMTIELFIYCQIAGYTVACVAGIIILQLKAPLVFVYRHTLLKEIIKKSFPFALLTFLMTVYYRIDAVMIERMLAEQGKLEAGIYASAYRLLDACNILGFMFAALLLPIFSRMLEKKQDVKPLLDLTHHLLFIASVVSAVSFIVYRNEIMQLLYDDADAYYAKVFAWLMLSFICISMMYIYGTLLTANGNLSVLNKMAFGGMLLNIILNVFLIPAQGALGSAIATVITQLILICIHIIVCYRIFHFSISKQKWLSTFAFLLLFICIAWLSQFISSHWALNLFCSMLAGIFPALLLRMITVKNITDTIRIYLKRN